MRHCFVQFISVHQRRTKDIFCLEEDFEGWVMQNVTSYVPPNWRHNAGEIWRNPSKNNAPISKCQVTISYFHENWHTFQKYMNIMHRKFTSPKHNTLISLSLFKWNDQRKTKTRDNAINSSIIKQDCIDKWIDTLLAYRCLLWTFF